MKQIYIISLFFLPFLGFSQLHIQPYGSQASFLYAEGGLVYVERGIHLEKNISEENEASFYLRNEAQLLQGSEISENSGNGFLSVFQEGNATAYTYNYWSSPVENTSGANFLGNMLYEPINKTHSRKALVTSDYNGKTTPLTISNRWIYKLSGQGYSDWSYIGTNFSLSPGEGFTMKGVDGTNTEVRLYGVENNPGNEQRYDFRGRPNSGTISLNITKGNILLVGNPYPSALDLNKFLEENKNTTGIAYFWDSHPVASHYLQDYEGGYGAYSPALGREGYVPAVFKKYDNEGWAWNETENAGEYYARRFTPIAQGFMIEGLETGAVKFKNIYREFKKENPEMSQFKTSATAVSNPDVPMFRLNIGFNDQYIRQLLLALHPASTESVDRAMDAKNLSFLKNDAGWLLEHDHYLINVLPEATFDVPIAISLSTDAKGEFSLAEKELFPYDIFLWDSKADIYYNLKNQQISVNLPAGENEEQFFITFSKKKDEPEDVEIKYNQEYKIFQNNSFNRAEIFSPIASPPQSISIYNLNGRKVREIKGSQNQNYYEISTSNLGKAIYIVKIISSEGTIVSKKVLISN